MTHFDFRFAPLFALVAALFAPLAQADDVAMPAALTDPSISVPALEQPQPAAADPLAFPSATPAPSADLWARVRQGFKMEDLDTPAVRAQERFYASKPEYMQRVVERSRRYLYFIVGEVERRGMPTEIALLPIVESAFVPKAQSHAMASGLWQFIPSTGKRYGLERTWWYDGRQDVMAATYAALDYLQDLYNLFGDWQLALAAYNWGEGGVGRALAKTRARGLEDDFDNIRKPRETENYVPKLLAIRNIIANPDAFGVKIPAVPNQPYFQPISTGRHMDLQLIAKLAETSVDELTLLNPGLIRPVFAHKDDRRLLLPADKVDTFERNLQGYDKPLLSWQPYVTKRGESLSAIADRFGIQLAELRDVNKLGGAGSASGQTILVPIRPDVDVSERQNLAALIAGAVAQTVDRAPVDRVASESREDTAPGARSSRAVMRYKVKRGDTLFSIARRNGMTPAELKYLNGLRTDHVVLGQTLKLGDDPAEARSGGKAGRQAAAKPARLKQYVVRHGDTLDEIARRYDVSVSDIKKWNRPLSKGVLKVGYKVEIRRDS
ncbi:LysM peptidoglycan-binding domain-containing protein [Chitinimonas koreensis]|uniref:LysM peptidoglycan-binding domain-containing protein n=1 Tax=Chitinimonas koreensis TaxID=356302 RepID=UPI000401BBE2|nr:LysM peptidoglycan-binding domain-containing protein [Chitinimonas koreensis]QNM97454.1 LysM peptidoglycan-binding domain-containing protein [Chitinimonas koreensis]